MTTKFTKEYQIPDSISLVLASPDVVRNWSHGEITKPETINYRTGRSERGGLFDERIFGPEKDYECYCGKYKGIRYKDIVCEKCGVEVTRSIVRRDRMGHIELASPVAHIWFLRGIPSRMGLLLEISITDLEKVIYFAGYIVTNIDEKEREKIIRDLNNEFKVKMKVLEKEEDKERLKELFSITKKEITDIKKFRVLSEIEYHNFSRKYGTMFEAGIGAEAIHDIFKSINLAELERSIEATLEKKDASATKDKLEKRLSLVRSLKNSELRPEWMFLQTIPVIPPALRPMVGLEGGRYATSDVNDLYRRVINRNNRLKKLKEIGAPDVILRNEKRILQEAVDSLIDNSIRKHSGSQAVSQSQKRQLKSLSDNLKGKQGLFRQNLLGKRVDYSGRSVIVVGPNLKLNQCGLPKYMALELFRPFVISKIIARELAFNIRGAGKLIEDATPEVWEILDEVIEGKYVLLNRAPTLHRLSIQAFQPVLIEGKAIKLHPLVCSAFNADFDGDQMAVHVPLSVEAQIEARELIASNKNLLRPQSGDPIVNPSQDIVLGCYWMTKLVEGAKGEGSVYSSPNEAIMAYDFGVVDFRAKIKVVGTDSKRYDAFNGQPFETSVGRLLFNSILPSDFPYMNEDQTKKKLSALVVKLINVYGVDATPSILDKIKSFGYKYVTISGTTLGYSDAQVPTGKKALIAEAKKKEEVILDQYHDGLISDDERYRKIIELWEGTTSQVGKLVAENLAASESIHDMVTPGARGDMGSLNQVAGMKGVIVDAVGKPIDFPIISSFKEGLSPLEYFINTHSARKGLTDTALNTAKAGYLTRRLHDVGQDVVITEEDCGTKEGIVARAENIDGIIRPITRMLFGRVLASDAKTADGTVIAKKGTLVSRDIASAIEKAGITEVLIRSPRTCATLHGLCQQCYGLDLGRNHLVKIGEAVGTIAAQAIGEPGTQLTLRTFHAGGVTGLDITTGLPRVEEIFEARAPKAEAVIATVDGLIADIRKDGEQKVIEVLADYEVLGSTGTKSRTVTYVIDPKRVTTVQKGARIKKGDLLTDGSAVLNDLFNIAGLARAQEYIVSEINRVYELHSAPISEKHIEIIARQMFSRRRITVPGDTRFTTGDVVENIIFIQENNRIAQQGGIEAKASTVVMGVAQVALTTESWLSSASFQNTNKVLISNAVRGGYDNLRGLKENIILGNLIPAGTGLSEEFVPAIKDSQQE